MLSTSIWSKRYGDPCLLIYQPGRTDHNEDSLRASAEQGVFVLADGLGGHGRGEVASALAVDTLFTAMTPDRGAGWREASGPVPVRQ